MEKPKRLQSLDALRGFDMFFIMGGGGLIVALATLFPTPFFQALAKQMTHVQWHGFHFEDMIFPLFLFIAGISFPFSVRKQLSLQKSKSAIYRKTVKRGITLVILGVVYNGLLNLDFENLRIASVLGRIGLAWMFAALIFIHTKTKGRVIIASTILVLYWLLLAFVPAPDAVAGVDVFSMEGTIVGYVDRILLPGRVLFNNMLDPEGILSTVPAISTALLGMLTGELVQLKKEQLSDNKKVLTLVGVGLGLVAIGLAWDVIFPINKNLWTSSFVCFVGGLSVLLFALFYWVIDVLEFRKWTFFFTVIGMNSITIYLAQRFINFRFTSNALFGGFIGLFPENMQPLLTSAGYITVCWLFLYFLYKKRIFLKV